MASYQMDINSLVYSYLLKKAPKCAELFSKSNQVKRLPSDTPSLEDIIQKAYPKAVSKKDTLTNKVGHDSSSDSDSEVPNPVQKQNVNINLNKNVHKSESSSDSSDSELVSSKPNVSIKGTTNPMISIALNRQHAAISKQASSSSSSDSDDEPPKSVAKPNLINVNKSLLQKAKKSSSSDDSESEPQNSKVSKSNIHISKMPPIKPTTKKSSSSSDDSSSEPGKKVQPPKAIPNKTSNWTSAISKLAAEFPDSSDSESDEAGISVSLAKKTSTPMGLTKNTNSSGVNLRNAALSKSKQSDSSDDSSSESECDHPKGLGNIPNVSKAKNMSMITLSVNKSPVSAKANVKESESSSDDSSDSEGVVKSKAPTLPSKTTPSIVKKPDHDVSSSDEDEKKPQSQIGKMAKTLSPKKPVQNITKKDSSSSDSEDEKVVSKPPLKQVQPGNKDSSTDTSSDSDDGTPSLKIPATTGNQMKPVKSNAAIKPLSKTPVKTSTLTASKKVPDSSSDSSSDEVVAAPVNKSIEKNVGIQRRNVIGQKSKVHSSSSSDSEDEPSQPITLSKTASPVKNILPAMKLTTQPPKATQETSDSSEDSSSSDEDNKKISLKGNQSRNVSGKVNNNLKMPGNKKDSSSSSDSEDEPSQPPVSSVNVAKNYPLKASSSSNKKSESSSDSSSDDDRPVNKPQPTSLSKVQAINSRKGKEEDTSSSSSSEDETPQPAKNFVSKVTTPKPSVQKQSSSSDSSDSDDVINPKENAFKKPDQVGVSSGKKMSTSSSNKTVPLTGKSTITNKQAESSSDSSSEDGGESKTYASVVKSLPQMGSKDSKAPKRKKQSSDSDEESESANNKAQYETQPWKRHKTGQQPFIPPQSQTVNKFGRNPVASDSTKQRRGSSPFRRVRSENFVVDHRLQKSAQLAKQSLPSFQGVRGKQFRHEKTKKKRLAHPGKVDLTVKSIKFDD